MLPKMAPAEPGSSKKKDQALPEFSFLYEKDKAPKPTATAPAQGAAPVAPAEHTEPGDSTHREKDEEGSPRQAVDKGKQRAASETTSDLPPPSGLRHRALPTQSPSPSLQQPRAPPTPEAQAQAQAQPQPQAQQQQQPPRNPVNATPVAQAQPPQESLVKGALDLLIFVVGSLFAYLVYQKYMMSPL